MYAKVMSAGVMGVDAYPVEVECDTGPGLCGFEVVGLPEVAVRESRVRIRSAVTNCGYKFPHKRITINLAPADVPKRGTIYDLPQAIALLAAESLVPGDALAGSLIVGEVALTGEVRSVPGVLPMAILAEKLGYKRIFLPDENAAEASVVRGIEVLPVRMFDEIVHHLQGDSPISAMEALDITDSEPYPFDMADIKGQDFAKEAITIAAAGAHNILMVGPPGSGKTMLARRLATIMPPMTNDESLECTKIYSVSGLLGRSRGLLTRRPFRAPHHTVSNAALVGGGAIPRPGEVSLAHNGILFLDELPEFPRHILECMRQPLEDRMVTVSRAAMACTFPASFSLVAAMNPCACGFRGDERRKCTCDPGSIRRYMSRLSGPLLDRIDMHVEVRGVQFDRLQAGSRGPCSAEMRERVIAARKIQLRRFQDAGIRNNAAMQPRQIASCCELGASARELLKRAFDHKNMSARSYDRVLKVARTIADLADSADIKVEHVAQALDFRQLDAFAL